MVRLAGIKQKDIYGVILKNVIHERHAYELPNTQIRRIHKKKTFKPTIPRQ